MFVAKASDSNNATFTVSGWDDGIYYIFGAAPFAETAAFSDAMVRVLDGKPYVQSLHGNVSLSGDTITVPGDGWYTYVVGFLITKLVGQFSVSRASGDCYSNDMNDVIKPGVYHVGTNVTLNKPSGAYGWGFLLVFASKTDHTLQLYVPDGKTGKVYWRSLWEGESGPWISVIGNELASAASASQVNSELS